MKQRIQFVRVAALLASYSAIAVLVLTGPFASLPAHADELKLKDGTQIFGTIVGFEESSFKVKTSYGFAVVQKDQVVSISMSDAAKSASDKKPDAAETKPAATDKPKSESAIVTATAQPAGPTSKSNAVAANTSLPTAKRNIEATVAKNSAMAALPVAATSASATPVAAAKPAAPEPIREEVTGNTYTNDTYRFRMYKPPDWDVIAAARALLPGAIAAMGTNDETTYLLIGQEPAGKSLASEMEATERRLRDIMENFRPLDEKQITVSGLTATEHRFRGSVDEHEWSGVVVLIPRGAKLYTIFGMTRADSDLVQIQENVIARAISSVQFTEP
jgi:hypothetical protein